MNVWTALADVLILLVAAMVLGGAFERFKQNAILGYLLAGTIVGPHALDLIPNHQALLSITELGVSLLLFVIGLEFSWRRLQSLGVVALGGGSLQVLVTTALSTVAGMMLGLEAKEAFVVGCILALSSTAVVVRILTDRMAIDSGYGRNALGILLLQDIFVIPLVIAVSVLGGDDAASQIHWVVAQALGAAIVLIGGFYLLLHHIVPRLLAQEEAMRNRDLPVLLAMSTAIGSAWCAHALGLSPVLGAFVAGVLLAESQFATQIRADVAPLKALFLTLFFSSIGALINLVWVLENWRLVIVLVFVIVCGKLIIVALVTRLFRVSAGLSVATGFCLAQVGEFSFVLADVARSGDVISGELFELMITVAVATLLLTPYLVSSAPRVARFVDRFGFDAIGKSSGKEQRVCPEEPQPEEPPHEELQIENHIVIVGFGPAGRQVAEKLLKEGHSLLVIELNPRIIGEARALGIPVVAGDASRWELLERACIASAKAVVVAVPDPAIAKQITAQVCDMAPKAFVVTRSRYHRGVPDLMRLRVGAVVDEEKEVGRRLAFEIRKGLKEIKK